MGVGAANTVRGVGVVVGGMAVCVLRAKGRRGAALDGVARLRGYGWVKRWDATGICI